MEGFGGTSEFRQAGESDTWISYGSTFGFVEGDIVGSFTADAYWIYHDWVGPVEDPFMLTLERGNGHVLLTIDPATVGGKTGTIKLRFNDVFGDEFAGTWAIFGGADELKGVTGQGIWYIDPGYGLFGGQAFEGQIHITP